MSSRPRVDFYELEIENNITALGRAYYHILP